MEWNWDWAWWQSPQRIVRPTKSDSGRPSEQRIATSRAVAEENSLANASPEDHPARPSPELSQSRQDARPFYQLYLVSGETETDDRADKTVHLRLAKARPAAVLLEMLCVPLGRSGNPEKCYLLYEDRGELEDAGRLALLLDVSAATRAGSTAGPSESFVLGVGLMLTVAEQAAVVEQTLVSAAAKHLTEAMQAESLDLDRRWAAGVLASRLMSEYKYDQGAARLLAQEAESLAAPDSREQFTAMYWRADALAQSGKTAEAAALHEEIARRYGPKVKASQIIKQPKAGTKKKRK